MIKHIVLMKFENPQNARIVANEMLSLKGCSPLLFDINTFLDFKHAKNSYDLMIEFLFENEEKQILFNDNEKHIAIRNETMKYAPISIKLDTFV